MRLPALTVHAGIHIREIGLLLAASSGVALTVGQEPLGLKPRTRRSIANAMDCRASSA
jgi:hypothetical protein